MHIYGTQSGLRGGFNSAYERKADPTTSMLEKLRLAMMATVELAINGLTVIAVDCDSLSVPHLMVARPSGADTEAWLAGRCVTTLRQANVITRSFALNGVNVRWLETVDAAQAHTPGAGVQEAA